MIDYELYHVSMRVVILWTEKNEYYKAEQDPTDKQEARISKTSTDGT
jgi:hypothetical protein